MNARIHRPGSARALVLCLAAATLGSAVACGPPAMGIVVRVDSDFVPVTELRNVSVLVARFGPHSFASSRTYDLASNALPGTIVVTTQDPDATHPLYVDITATLATGRTLQLRYIGGFERDRMIVLDAFVARRCTDMMCAAGMTCGRCGCAASHMTNLQDYSEHETLTNYDSGVICAPWCGDLQTDPNNCGACGNVCAEAANASVRCTAGACTLTCNAGFADCNHASGDGCEVPTQSHDSCGACELLRVCSNSEECRVLTTGPPTCCTAPTLSCSRSPCGSFRCETLNGVSYCCR